MYRIIPYEYLLVKQKAELFDKGILVDQLYFEKHYYLDRHSYQIKRIARNITDVKLKKTQFQTLIDLRVVKKGR